MEKNVSIQEFQTKTDELLSWVEERKMNGFVKNEVDRLREILKECQKKESFTETVENLKEQVRKWIRDRWNPSVIGKEYQRYHNHTPRAKVLLEFPSLLRGYLEILSHIAQYELDETEQEIFTQVCIRLDISMMLLELKDSEKKESPEERKKSRRTKPPRANK